MPRACTVCTHSERPAIDRELVGGTAAIRNLAERFGLSPAALLRHRESHLPRLLVKAKAAEEQAEAGTLLAKLEKLEARIARALDQAEASKDYRGVFAGVREMRELVRLLGELRGELESGPRVQVAVNVQAAPAELDPDTLEHEARLALELAAELRAGALTVEGRALPEAAP